MKNIILGCLFCFSLTLCAGEQDIDEDRSGVIRAGSSVLSLVDTLKIKEERAKRYQEQQETQDKERPAEERVSNGAYSYTSHAGVYHNPMVVSYLGDTVELEDTSLWIVKATDRYKTLDWFTSDVIVITPNHNWFSNYDYCLINIDRGITVQVKLAQVNCGLCAHWITAVDYAYDQIYLEDGSIWDISGFDHTIMRSWLPGDSIIIGLNDGIFNTYTPNILINVNKDNYVTSNCIY